ncbi:UDP-glucose:glycoprotein glucosyltransferase 2 [Varanus komodoensis]|nr:UDP-glucose:glycoprotein glucosyltransferase 2 [Varanus komodoensis]
MALAAPVLAAAVLLLCACPRGGESSPRKAVAARLAAKWPATPLLLEASEFIAEESNEQFWQFLETVKELAVYKKGASDHSYYNLILKKAGQFLTNMQINLLKFSLSLRAYSPTVQMFQQIAADEPSPKGCSAFVVIHGKSTCKADEIKKLLKKAAERPKPYLFKGDHKFPTLNETVPVVILYAEMGTKDFATFHEVLSEKARKEEIVYILRHFVQKPISKKMYLSGYGVELAIKSTEYKAVDDFQAEAKRNTTEEDVDEESEVQGFLFDTLKQNYPDLRDNLTELRKYLIESSDDTEPLKVWELQDLSFQAASRILSVPVYSAVKVMKDIAQNFPVKARYEDATELWCTHATHPVPTWDPPGLHASWAVQTAAVSWSEFYRLRLACWLCLYQERTDPALVIHALVMFRLDYCNGLHMRLP